MRVEIASERFRIPGEGRWWDIEWRDPLATMESRSSRAEDGEVDVNEIRVMVGDSPAAALLLSEEEASALASQILRVLELRGEVVLSVNEEGAAREEADLWVDHPWREGDSPRDWEHRAMEDQLLGIWFYQVDHAEIPHTHLHIGELGSESHRHYKALVAHYHAKMAPWDPYSDLYQAVKDGEFPEDQWNPLEPPEPEEPSEAIRSGTYVGTYQEDRELKGGVENLKVAVFALEGTDKPFQMDLDYFNSIGRPPKILVDYEIMPDNSMKFTDVRIQSEMAEEKPKA